MATRTNPEPIVTAPRVMVPIAAGKVEAAEGRLRFRFPAGYREFMARYGEAFYSNDLRVHGPDHVVEQNVEWRLGEGEYFFWTDPESALGRDRAPECVRYADTIFGDVLAVHPAIAGASFLFPRSSFRIHRFDGDLVDTLDWVLSSGICLAPTRGRYVEPLSDITGDAAGWRDLEGPSFDGAIQKVAALDERGQVVREIVNEMHRAEIFLPRYEARVRLEARTLGEMPEIELLSFLDDLRAKAEFRRALQAVGIEIV